MFLKYTVVLPAVFYSVNENVLKFYKISPHPTSIASNLYYPEASLCHAHTIFTLTILGVCRESFGFVELKRFCCCQRENNICFPSLVCGLALSPMALLF